MYPLDVADAEATDANPRAADRDMEGIDLVVANAGSAATAGRASSRYADCAPIIAVNVRAPSPP